MSAETVRKTSMYGSHRREELRGRLTNVLSAPTASLWRICSGPQLKPQYVCRTIFDVVVEIRVDGVSGLGRCLTAQGLSETCLCLSWFTPKTKTLWMASIAVVETDNIHVEICHAYYLSQLPPWSHSWCSPIDPKQSGSSKRRRLTSPQGFTMSDWVYQLKMNYFNWITLPLKTPTVSMCHHSVMKNNLT